jgi:hypothetical protein
MAAGPKELDDFIRQALTHAKRAEVEAILLDAGWPARQVAASLAAYVDRDFPVPVPRPRVSLTSQEAFLFLVLFSSLYFAAFHLCSALFDVIDLAFLDNGLGDRPDYVKKGLRWSASALIIAFPLFLFMAWRVGRDLDANPAKRLSSIRRWLTYLTLFLAALTLVCDLTTLVYNMLGGELTTRFLLKVLSLAVVGACVFGYYLWDLRREGPAVRSAVPAIMLAAAAVMVCAVAAGALSVLDSPAVAREKRRDTVLAEDLGCMQREIGTLYRKNKVLPSNMEVAGLSCLNNPLSVSGATYVPTGAATYRLCATFRYSARVEPYGAKGHPAGYYCINENAAERE